VKTKTENQFRIKNRF